VSATLHREATSTTAGPASDTASSDSTLIISHVKDETSRLHAAAAAAAGDGGGGDAGGGGGVVMPAPTAAQDDHQISKVFCQAFCY